MQGPADETDHDIKKNMVRKQGVISIYKRIW